VWCLLILLMVWIHPFVLLLSSLHRLRHHVALSDSSLTPFECSIGQDLLSPQHLLLHGVHLILLGLLLFHELCFTNLHLSFKVHLIDLALIEPFKVIWLYSMWSQHAHFRRWILSHEIMVIGML